MKSSLPVKGLLARVKKDTVLSMGITFNNEKPLYAISMDADSKINIDEAGKKLKSKEDSYYPLLSR
jgi:hypothetical protein